jgi:hypothetical protein
LFAQSVTFVSACPHMKAGSPPTPASRTVMTAFPFLGRCSPTLPSQLQHPAPQLGISQIDTANTTPPFSLQSFQLQQKPFCDPSRSVSSLRVASKLVDSAAVSVARNMHMQRQ